MKVKKSNIQYLLVLIFISCLLAAMGSGFGLDTQRYLNASRRYLNVTNLSFIGEEPVFELFGVFLNFSDSEFLYLALVRFLASLGFYVFAARQGISSGAVHIAFAIFYLPIFVITQFFAGIMFSMVLIAISSKTKTMENILFVIAGLTHYSGLVLAMVLKFSNGRLKIKLLFIVIAVILGSLVSNFLTLRYSYAQDISLSPLLVKLSVCFLLLAFIRGHIESRFHNTTTDIKAVLLFLFLCCCSLALISPFAASRFSNYLLALLLLFSVNRIWVSGKFNQIFLLFSTLPLCVATWRYLGVI